MTDYKLELRDDGKWRIAPPWEVYDEKNNVTVTGSFGGWSTEEEAEAGLWRFLRALGESEIDEDWETVFDSGVYLDSETTYDVSATIPATHQSRIQKREIGPP